MPLENEPFKNEWTDDTASEIDRYWSTSIMEMGIHAIEGLGCLEYCKVGGSILEVGCGTGHIWDILKGTNIGKYTGLDISPAMLKIFKNKAPDIDLIEGNSAALPFADDSSDATICMEVIRHITNFEDTIRELYRVAKRVAIFSIEVVEGPSVYKGEDRRGSYINSKEPFVHYQVEHNATDFMTWLGKEFNCKIEIRPISGNKWLFALCKDDPTPNWVLKPIHGITELVGLLSNLLSDALSILKDDTSRMPMLKVETSVKSVIPLEIRFVGRIIKVDEEKDNVKGV